MDRKRERSKDMVQRVTHNDRLLAIIVPRDFGEPGVNFITADDATLQLGLLNHPKSKIIQPHVHKVRPREVTVTQEVLFLRKGKLRVDFYDDDETYLESRILEQGDTILLVSGGHRSLGRAASRRPAATWVSTRTGCASRAARTTSSSSP